MQIEGTCEKISLPKAIKPAGLYIKRFPKIAKFIKHPSDFVKKYDSKIFRITPSWIKILDEKVFGKEVWKEVSI